MGREIHTPPTSAPILLPDSDPHHPAHTARLLQAAIGDHATDFLIQSFDDRVFVSVSQMDKLGTLVRACAHAFMQSSRSNLLRR